MSIWSRITSADPDQLFGYTTYKIVKVKDRYLGLLYYGSVICIFAYILYNIFTQELYLKKSPPTAGFVRATAQLNVDPLLPLPSYCAKPPPASRNTIFGGCLSWTAQQIVFPFEGELNTVFLTTRVTVATTPRPAEMSPPCANFYTSPGCQPPSLSQIRATKNVTTYYIANIEKVSLQLDHGVRVHFGSSMFGAGSQSFSSKMMKGRMLMGCAGDEEKYLLRLDWTEAYRTNTSTDNHLDTFFVNDLLISANCAGNGQPIDLEGLSTADGADVGESWRSSGFVISSPIIYRNRANIREADEIKYRYVPAQIDGTEYKLTEIQTNGDGSLTYINRHGIRIVFDQTGQIGVFDFIQLLTALVAALALLRVASLVVEVLMLWVMPHRLLYKKAKFESTEDFSDIRDRLNDEKGARPYSGEGMVTRRTEVLRANEESKPEEKGKVPMNQDLDIGAAMGGLYAANKV